MAAFSTGTVQVLLRAVWVFPLFYLGGDSEVMQVISARAAFDAGLTRYFSGLPCKHGHIAQRMVSNGSCVDCLKVRTRARVKVWRKAHPDKVLEQARRYREKHPETNQKAKAKYRASHLEEVRRVDKERQRTIRATNPEKQRERVVHWRARREAKLAAIAGTPRPETCDLCGEFNRQICFDHCHATNQFRGWLCDRCNKVLGLVKDSPELLGRMAAYVRPSSQAAD